MKAATSESQSGLYRDNWRAKETGDKGRECLYTCAGLPASLSVFLQFGKDEFGYFFQRVEDALSLNGDGFESRFALDR